MEYYQCFLVANACYIANKKITPQGIVVHSTGANNPNLKRYVQPLPDQTVGVTKSASYMLSVLGKNQYDNDWNHYYADNAQGREACVNAFIGKLADGNAAIVQTLPWDMRPWGCGKGANGSYNNSHIQFEICEDDLTNRTYFDAVMKKAVELCAFLCLQYGFSAEKVVSHQESYKQGYGSNHSDIDHWLKKFNYTMTDFREWVKNKIDEERPMTDAEKKEINAKFDAVNKKTAELTTAIDKLAKTVHTNYETMLNAITDIKTEIKPSISRFNNANSIPDYAKNTIDKLIKKEYLYGGENGDLRLSEQMVRIFVILDRAGVFDGEEK